MMAAEDQTWCLKQADKAKSFNAPTVEKMLRDASNDPDEARICREQMQFASKAAAALRAKRWKI